MVGKTAAMNLYEASKEFYDCSVTYILTEALMNYKSDNEFTCYDTLTQEEKVKVHQLTHFNVQHSDYNKGEDFILIKDIPFYVRLIDHAIDNELWTRRWAEERLDDVSIDLVGRYNINNTLVNANKFIKDVYDYRDLIVETYNKYITDNGGIDEDGLRYKTI